jgi:hypothetical protein
VSKGGASAPPAVDPSALAAAQGQANQASALQSSILSNVNTQSPLGTSLFGLQPSGQWNLSQTLTPQAQNVLNNQQNLVSNLAGNAANIGDWSGSNAPGGADLVNRALNLGGIPNGPLSFSGLTPIPTSTTDFSNEVNKTQNAAYNAQTGYLDPQFKQKQSDLTQQLADQGISAGSDAFDRAQGDLGRQQTLAYQQAQDAAVAAGNQEQQALYGENLQSRQQGANEALQSYQSLPNLISSLVGSGENALGGAAGNLATLGSLGNFNWAGGVPTFGGSPTSVSPANVVGAQQVAANNAANRFTAGNTLNNQLFNGLGSLGGALGGSNLLFGSQGLSGALGLSPSTGLLGSLFGGGGSAAAAPSFADLFGAGLLGF